MTPEIEEGKLTGRGTAESGGHGGRVPLDAEEISLLRDKIHIGTDVFDYDDRKVGSVQAYTPKRDTCVSKRDTWPRGTFTCRSPRSPTSMTAVFTFG